MYFRQRNRRLFRGAYLIIFLLMTPYVSATIWDPFSWSKLKDTFVDESGDIMTGDLNMSQNDIYLGETGVIYVTNLGSSGAGVGGGGDELYRLRFDGGNVPVQWNDVSEWYFPDAGTTMQFEVWGEDTEFQFVAEGGGTASLYVQNNITANDSIFTNNYLNSSGDREWIKPENIYDVDKEDIETDLNTFVDIGGDTMTGELIAPDATITDTITLTTFKDDGCDEINPDSDNSISLALTNYLAFLGSYIIKTTDIFPIGSYVEIGLASAQVLIGQSGGTPIIRTPVGSNIPLIILADGSGDVRIEGVNISSNDVTTSGAGTFGSLDVNTLNLDGNVISDSTGTISFDDDNLETTGDVTASDMLTNIYWFDSIGGNTYIAHGGPGGGVFTLANRDSRAALNLYNDVVSITVFDLPAGAASDTGDSVEVMGRAEFNYDLFVNAGSGQNPFFGIWGYPSGLSLVNARHQIVNDNGATAYQINTTADRIIIPEDVRIESLDVTESSTFGGGFGNTGCTIYDNGNASCDGNITADNVFLLADIYAHTNATIPVVTPGIWYNVTFNEEASTPVKDILHTHNDATNDTFTPVHTGTYDLSASITIEDSNPTPGTHVLMRFIKNGVEIPGSLLEEDSTKQYADYTIPNGPHVDLVAGDEIKLQFTASDTSVSMKSHLTYGTHRDSATFKMVRIR